MGRPRGAFRIVWASSLESKNELVPLVTSQPIHGIIRNKSGWGVRVKREDFAKIYQVLHPGQEVPVELEINHTWRIAPIPIRVKAEALGAVGWSIRITKFLGSNVAIAVSKEKPPDAVLAINQHPILITELPGRKPATRTVVARSQPASRTQRPPVDQDILQIHDPWARSTTKPASTPQSARVPTITQGPIEQQLKQHESELSALRGNRCRSGSSDPALL